MDDTFLFVILLVAPVAGAIVSILPKEGIEVLASLVSAVITVLVALVFFASGVAGTFDYFYADGLTRIMVITISCVFLTSVAYSAFYVKHIKEPFYTTKSNGTGLGMWVTNEIVKRHRGRLRIRSSTEGERHGTIFSIFLPGRAAAGDAECVCGSGS